MITGIEHRSIVSIYDIIEKEFGIDRPKVYGFMKGYLGIAKVNPLSSYDGGWSIEFIDDHSEMLFRLKFSEYL